MRRDQSRPHEIIWKTALVTPTASVQVKSAGAAQSWQLKFSLGVGTLDRGWEGRSSVLRGASLCREQLWPTMQHRRSSTGDTAGTATVKVVPLSCAQGIISTSCYTLSTHLLVGTHPQVGPKKKKDTDDWFKNLILFIRQETRVGRIRERFTVPASTTALSLLLLLRNIEMMQCCFFSPFFFPLFYLYVYSIYSALSLSCCSALA